jgi:hypothetical protein
VGLTTPHRVKVILLRNVTKGLELERDSLDIRPKLRKMDMRFCSWNVKSLYEYRVGSLMTVAKVTSKYSISYI